MFLFIFWVIYNYNRQGELRLSEILLSENTNCMKTVEEINRLSVR
jgi:hypothetical protein